MNDVQVWIVSTEISAEENLRCRTALSLEERARADRFVHEADRHRYVASHAFLRARLGEYCGIRPEALEFAVGSHGKPFLSHPAASVQFNLSHSGTLAAIALADGACGVDIESHRAHVRDRAIAERFFCARENAWLQSLDSKQRTHGFFRLWAVKEAILKADGKGLAIPLSSVDAASVIDGTSASVTLPTDAGGTKTLWVCELNAADGYAAALAIEANPEQPPHVRLLPEAKNSL